MTTNIFYRYDNREYTLKEREELENEIGSIYLEHAEEIAKENFSENGFGLTETYLPNGMYISISIEREVDDEDDSEEFHVTDDSEGIFSDLYWEREEDESHWSNELSLRDIEELNESTRRHQYIF